MCYIKSGDKNSVKRNIKALSFVELLLLFKVILDKINYQIPCVFDSTKTADLRMNPVN